MGTLATLLLTACLAAPARAELYFEAFGGKGMNLSSDLDVSQPGSVTDVRYRSVKWNDRSFDPSPYYGYRFGYFFESAPSFGVRLQFLHHKALAETARPYEAQGVVDGARVGGPTPLNAKVQWLEVTHGLNMVTLAAVGRVAMRKGGDHPRGRAQAYGGFGLGPVITHAESTVGGLNHETPYKLQGSPAFELFAGLRYFVTRRWLGLAEYKATEARLDVEIAGGRAGARIRAHHLTFGLGVTLF